MPCFHDENDLKQYAHEIGVQHYRIYFFFVKDDNTKSEYDDKEYVEASVALSFFFLQFFKVAAL